MLKKPVCASEPAFVFLLEFAGNDVRACCPNVGTFQKSILSPLSETLSQTLSGFVGNKRNFDKVSDEVSDKDPEERVLGAGSGLPPVEEGVGGGGFSRFLFGPTQRIEERANGLLSLSPSPPQEERETSHQWGAELVSG